MCLPAAITWLASQRSWVSRHQHRKVDIMPGLGSLLDDTHYRLVEDLWAELEGEFGLRGVYVTPWPHLSYQVAEGYDVELLEPALRRMAARQPTFQVTTAGLGIFTDPQPVLYVPVVRAPALDQFFRNLWTATAQAVTGAWEYYYPARWVPHITLAHGDVDQNNLPEVVRLLAGRAFNWEITVDNITFVDGPLTEQELRFRFDFGVRDQG